MSGHLPRRAGERTAGRILELLRRGPMTVDELCTALELTRTAVRAQLTKLQQEELVELRESRRGTSKPAQTYGVTTQAELLFSRAYIPILTHLLHVISQKLAPAEFAALMREAGRSAMQGRSFPRGSLQERVESASLFLNDLGGLTEVEEEVGSYRILSHGCPLAAGTAEHPEVCDALESLLSEFVGAKVEKCCDRYDRVRCCFEVPREPGVAETAH